MVPRRKQVSHTESEWINSATSCNLLGLKEYLPDRFRLYSLQSSSEDFKSNASEVQFYPQLPSLQEGVV